MTSVVKYESEWSGILMAGLAYAFWGITPLYWRLVGDFPPFQLTVQRVVWSAVFMAGLTLARGRLAHIATILRTPRLFGTLALTSILITLNWSFFIYCVMENRLLEASLGYYLTPLLSIALGVMLFGERLSRMRLVGLALAAIAVAVQAVAFGHIPWIGLALSLSFGFYGYFRKKAPVDSMDGLFIETALMFPFALGLVIWWALGPKPAFPSPDLFTDAIVVLGGPVSAVPLAVFAAGARRMRLSTLGFLQYISPTLTLLMATLVFREPFKHTDMIGFSLLWTALAIVALEGRFRRARLSGPGLA